MTDGRHEQPQQGCRGYGDSHGDSHGYGYGMGMGTVDRTKSKLTDSLNEVTGQPTGHGAYIVQLTSTVSDVYTGSALVAYTGSSTSRITEQHGRSKHWSLHHRAKLSTRRRQKITVATCDKTHSRNPRTLTHKTVSDMPRKQT